MSSILFKQKLIMVSEASFSTNWKWISVSCSPFSANHFSFMSKGLPESANHSEYRFQELLFLQRALVGGFRSLFDSIVLIITKRSSVKYKTFWIPLKGVPESANLFELWFQEFLQALFFLNRTKRSCWKRKSFCFALSEAPLSINKFWFELTWKSASLKSFGLNETEGKWAWITFDSGFVVIIQHKLYNIL